MNKPALRYPVLSCGSRIAALASILALVPRVALTADQAVTQRDTAQAQPGVPVVVQGDTLFRLVGPVGPFTPAERARALARRVDSLAADPLAKAAAVTVADTFGVSDIRLGDFVVMTVTSRDAAEAGVERQQLAAEWASRIQESIRSRESSATLVSVLLGILKTLAATAVFVLLFKLLNRLFPTLYARIQAWHGAKRIPAIRIQKLELVSAARVTDALLVVAKALRVVAVLFLVYLYLPLVLSFFPWTEGLSTTLFDWVLNPLNRALTGFVDFLPNLFTIAVIAVVIYYLLKFIHLFFDGISSGAIALPGFHAEWAEPTYKIVRFLVLVFGVIMIYPYLPGSGTDAFQGISVLLGLLISFGSASAIANVVAGVVMTYMRPFQVGDRVKIADTTGDIVEKTLLVTRVRTIKNVDITIPNAMVLSSHIINFSSSAKDRGLILHTGVTIGYDVPWRQVHELLLAAADATEPILKNPKPFVLQTSLDDSYVSYQLNAFTEQPGIMARIYSELHQNIQDKFNEAGVEIMSPHYGAMRDGNQVTIPTEYLPKSYEAPAFRLFQLGQRSGGGPSDQQA